MEFLLVFVLFCCVSSLCRAFLHSRSAYGLSTKLLAKKNWDPPKKTELVSFNDGDNGITYSVEMAKSSGITWGSDLSFRWVYVMDVDPNGEAASTGMVEKGDYIIGFGNTSLIAQDFDFVLTVSCH